MVEGQKLDQKSVKEASNYVQLFYNRGIKCSLNIQDELIRQLYKGIMYNVNNRINFVEIQNQGSRL